MKKSLIKHIEFIIHSLQVDVSTFDVFDTNADILPYELNNYLPEKEFLVVLICVNDYDIDFLVNLLSSMLEKKISAIYENKIIFWEEGEYLSNNTPYLIEDDFISTLENEEITEIEKLNTTTRIPSWLDILLFKKLNAIYAPDYQKFEYNLELTVDDLKIYLGTYFPRSYAESFCIFDNIFQNKKYTERLISKELKILDIGCGSGGQLIGLLTVIEKYCHDITNIDIYAFDGNKEALVIIETIIEEFQKRTKKIIQIKTFHAIFENLEDFNLLDYNIREKFDFIISFKFICELINKGNGSSIQSYFHLTNLCLPLLKENGLFLPLDVTTKSINTEYLPVLMNFQINAAIQNNSDFKTLIPVSCSKYGHICNISCFYQQIFKVSHNLRKNDISKVAYRVVAQTNFVDSISSAIDAKYVIKWDNKKQNNENDYCYYCTQHEYIFDSFNLNK